MTDIFADIRPYGDKEIPEAMKRIVESVYFPIVADYIYKGEDIEKVKQLFLSLQTIEQFQHKVMYDAYSVICRQTIDSLSCSGFERIDKSKGYLYISNHRDIVLDSLLHQAYLFACGIPTGEITFGENLMTVPFCVDIGKSNKMFKVYRSGSMREFIMHSFRLSQYIRDRVVNNNVSVWIAQRNGRTKDGNDRTETGLTKMIGMSSDRSLESYLALNIVPCSVSYEIEPCDLLKTNELYKRKLNGDYTKSRYEDFHSIVQGITQQKGRVEISLSAPVTKDDFSRYGGQDKEPIHKTLAKIIDSYILSHYRLFPNNYIAHDLLSGSCDYSDYYSKEQKEWFEDYYKSSISTLSGDRQLLSSIFLGIYANPVDAKIKRVTK